MNIFQIFSKTTVEKPPEGATCLYVRTKQPSALQGWHFSAAAAAALPDSLSATGLTWIWESTRTGPPLQNVDDEINPEHRPRQLLNIDSAEVLKQDLLEKNLHGFRRFVALYGGTGDLKALESDDALREEVENFAAGKKSALAALIVQLGDVAADVIYFDDRSKDIIDDILSAIGQPKIDLAFSIPYKEMKGEDLETVMEYLSCAEHDH